MAKKMQLFTRKKLRRREEALKRERQIHLDAVRDRRPKKKK